MLMLLDIVATHPIVASHTVAPKIMVLTSQNIGANKRLRVVNREKPLPILVWIPTLCLTVQHLILIRVVAKHRLVKVSLYFICYCSL